MESGYKHPPVIRLYSWIFRHWKARRFEMLLETIRLSREMLVLDVGGCLGDWNEAIDRVARVDCLNTGSPPDSTPEGYRYIQGDGCRMDFQDGAYDLVYSNSTIEHVGDFERQIAFANEVRRVGKALWIQTPALECPIEPHLMLPFVHWLPRGIRRRVAVVLSPRTWLFRETSVGQVVDKTRLLSLGEMRRLFPDCEIRIERIAWVLPKSYIAIRKACVTADRR